MAHDQTEGLLLYRLDSGTGELLRRPGLCEAFLGGRGLGVALVAEFGDPRAQVRDPAQPFVLAAGPLTGTSAPSSGRFAAVGVSPLTGTIFDGNAGGRFGVRLRQAGLDALVLVGKAPEWSVLVVDGRSSGGIEGAGRGRLVPLRELWPHCDPDDPALVSSEVVAGLRRALGSGYSLIFPSVAGRRGALLGSLRTDDRRNIGRGGMGAALAAKRVFAIAVAGDRSLGPADPERFDFLVYEAQKQLGANPVTNRALPTFGTAVLMQIVYQAGALPCLNYRTAVWDGVGAVSGETVRDSLTTGHQGCFGCRIRCTRRVGAVEGPEYESLWALGAACGVSDLAAVQEANRLCGELGLDTISAGATIACAMELSEEGVLGRNLRFGDGDRMVELIHEMAQGRGFGAELADGSARLAARHGRPDAAMHVKGLELPGYDPRGMHGQGLAYATSNRGACHLRGNMLGPEILGVPKLIDRFATWGKSGILITLQHLYAVFDSACLCKFAGFAFGDEILARLVSAATGSHVSECDLLRIGERIWNLERLWNLAAGFSRSDDRLPGRILHEPFAEGPSAGRSFDLTAMLDEYYRARGWDAAAVPSAEKLRSLGLEELAADFGLEDIHRRAGSGGPGGRSAAAPVAAYQGGPGQGWRPEITHGEARHLRAV